jgi:hypothetical protein
MLDERTGIDYEGGLRIPVSDTSTTSRALELLSWQMARTSREKELVPPRIDSRQADPHATGTPSAVHSEVRSKVPQKQAPGIAGGSSRTAQSSKTVAPSIVAPAKAEDIAAAAKPTPRQTLVAHDKPMSSSPAVVKTVQSAATVATINEQKDREAVSRHEKVLLAEQQRRAAQERSNQRALDLAREAQVAQEQKKQAELRALALTVAQATVPLAAGTPPPHTDDVLPLAVGVIVQCGGCHNDRDLSMFHEQRQVFKTCLICRLHSAKYHAQHREAIAMKRKRALAYSNQVRHPCPCGSIMLKLSRRSHEKSKRHRLWMASGSIPVTHSLDLVEGSPVVTSVPASSATAALQL